MFSCSHEFIDTMASTVGRRPPGLRGAGNAPVLCLAPRKGPRTSASAGSTRRADSWRGNPGESERDSVPAARRQSPDQSPAGPGDLGKHKWPSDCRTNRGSIGRPRKGLWKTLFFRSAWTNHGGETTLRDAGKTGLFGVLEMCGIANVDFHGFSARRFIDTLIFMFCAPEPLNVPRTGVASTESRP